MPQLARPSAFAMFAAKHGVDHVTDFSKRMGVGTNVANKLAAGKLAPNHPHIARIASLLQVTPEQLAPFCKGTPLPDLQVRRLTTRLANQARGRSNAKRTGLMLHPTESSVAKKGRRNSLKRQELNLREAVRGIVTTTNVAVMKGERYVPNIPTEALYLVLSDYAERRGIKTAVVLHPHFAELFD